MEIDCEKSYPIVQYGTGEDSPVYIRLCPHCGRFVKADEYSSVPEYVKENATCARCGRVKMPFFTWAVYLEDNE